MINLKFNGLSIEEQINIDGGHGVYDDGNGNGCILNPFQIILLPEKKRSIN